MTVGQPEVVTRIVDGKVHEPFEQPSADVPTEYLGADTLLLSGRKGEMSDLAQGDTRVRMDYRVPSRGLIGFYTEFLTITRGAGIVSHVFDGYGPWVERSTTGCGARSSPTAPAPSPATPRRAGRPRRAVRRPGHHGQPGHGGWAECAIRTLKSQHVTGKKCTNVHRLTGEEFVRLTPPTILNLEQAPRGLRR